MQDDSTILIRSAEYAKKAHKGQKRRNGDPYFTHVDRVAGLVISNYDNHLVSTPDVNVLIVGSAAHLHDTVEDTDTTIEDIHVAFGPTVATIVELLTHKKGDSYYNYILDILDAGGMIGAAARFIKCCDIHDNLNDHSGKPMRRDTIAKYQLSAYLLGITDIKKPTLKITEI